MSAPLLGLSYLGFARGRPGAYSWQSFNTTTWNHLPEFFHSATADDVATAGDLAAYMALSFVLDVNKQALAAFPKLAAFYAKVETLPGVQEYLAKDQVDLYFTVRCRRGWTNRGRGKKTQFQSIH